MLAHVVSLLKRNIVVAGSHGKTTTTSFLATILEKLNASKYITGSGPGSIRYINEEDFSSRGIELVWQHYKHPSYPQLHGDFIPYMNILDLLFNVGPISKNII